MTDSNEKLATVGLPNSLAEVEQYARVFVHSNMFPDIKSASQGMVKIIAGLELGIPPFAAIRGINIIQGKPELAAHLMASLIKKSGRYDYRVEEWTDASCKIKFLESTPNSDQKTVLGHSSFNIDDAERAGLINKDNWKKHPKAMYFARAMSQGARTFCPDVFSGAIYTEGELHPVDTKYEQEKSPELLEETNPDPVDEPDEVETPDINEEPTQADVVKSKVKNAGWVKEDEEIEDGS